MFSGLFRQKDWYIIVPLGIVGLALGVWGFSTCNPGPRIGVDSVGALKSLGAALSKTVGLVFLRGMNSDACVKTPSWQLSIAQMLLPIIALVGAAKLFIVNLRRDVRVAMAGGAHDHVIVCGLGVIGRQVVEGLRARGRAVVAITLDADHPNSLACERLGVAVLKSDAGARNILRHAGIARANAIVTTTGSDAKNLEIGLQAAGMSSFRRAPFKVVAEMRSGWLLDRLRGASTAVLGNSGVDVQLFNLHAETARALLRSSSFLRVYGGRPSGYSPRLVVAGFDEFASNFIERAICSNFAVPGVEPWITVLAENAADAEGQLRERTPGIIELGNFTFQTCQFGHPSTPADIEQYLADKHVDAIVVALADDDQALFTALQFRAVLDKQGHVQVPVFVRLEEQHELGDLLHHLEGHPLLPDRLVPFGDLRELTSPGVLLEGELDEMARAAHDVYLAQGGHSRSSPSHVPWERLPERLKSSNRNLADHIPIALGIAGYRVVPVAAIEATFDAETIDTLARAEHWRWLVERRAEGWSYAAERDESLKQSPELKEWEDMDEGERDLERARARALPAIVAKTGQSIKRERVRILGESPESDVDSTASDELALHILDPLNGAHWAAARRAIAENGARIRLRWGGVRAISEIDIPDDFGAFSTAMEGWEFPDAALPQPPAAAASPGPSMKRAKA